MTEQRQILVGMSGGVDSSAAAVLLQEAGWTATGATLLLSSQSCSGGDSVADAAAVCNRLEIPHLVWGAESLFRQEVQDYFAASYQAGRTPNPCVRCNRTVKFPALFDAAGSRGIRHVATGHYARIARQGDRYLLKKGLDRQKDQSYFLYALPAPWLEWIRFPLGELTKEEVREIAAAHQLVNAKKRDSQDVCFIPDGDYAAFLEGYTGKAYPPGDFLDQAGRVIGTHQGHIRYTLGQRRGLNIALGQRAYVTGKDPVQNTVTLGPDASLYTRRVLARGLNFLACGGLDGAVRLQGKTRYTQSQSDCTARQVEEDLLEAVFDRPQRAVTPGQALVLYDGDTVVCGGTIVEG